jgi:modulator of FtsH protease
MPFRLAGLTGRLTDGRGRTYTDGVYVGRRCVAPVTAGRELHLHTWSGFFQGQLGAAAALAGLLFVSLSVNQQRILALGRMADRGADALLKLLLVVIVSSLMLIPDETPRSAGVQMLVVSPILLAAITVLQVAYIKSMAAEHRIKALRIAISGQLAVWLMIAGATMCVVRNDLVGVHVLAGGILATFANVGVSAWVLLIEINR